LAQAYLAPARFWVTQSNAALQTRAGMMIQVSFLLFFALAVNNGDAQSPVRKVVTLLEDMKAQVSKDAEADKEAYDKYACWCETNKGEKTEAVEKAKARIADLEAVIEESVATAAQMKTEIAEHKKAIEEDRDSLATAEANRAEENEAFAKESADLKECITGLTKALEVLSEVQLLQKRGHGMSSPRVRVLLLQARSAVSGIHSKLSKFRGVMQKDLWDMMGALKVGGGSTFLGHHDMLTQEDLFQPAPLTDQEAGMEAKKNDLTGAASGAKSYNARSGEIYGLLQKMLEGFKESLAEAEKLESASLKSFEELRKAKLSEIALASGQVTAKEARFAEAQAQEAQAKEDIETTTEALGADEKFLLTLEEDCKTADEEFSARSKSRGEEIVALSEAISILSEDDARDLFGKSTISFLQLDHRHGTVVKSVSAEEAAQNKLVNQAMQRLLHSARKNKDWLLASLAVRVRIDGFAKVKELMDKMIAELKVQQKEEVEKKDFCVKEIDTTEDQIKTSTNEKESLEATKVKLEGDFAKYTNTLEAVSADLADMQVSLKKIGEDRAAANMVYQQTIKDQRATIHIIKKAEERLQQYYSSKAAFAQQAPPPTGTGSYEKSSSAGHVLQMLATVIKDAEAAETEMVVDEKNAQKEYENIVKDLYASMEANKAAIAENSKHKDSTAGEQAETDGALLAKNDEISKLEETLSSVHAGCDYLLKYFDIRQSSRSQEMEAIAEAKAILSGASFGAALAQGADASGSA